MPDAEIDRDTDGELLIDWSPGKGRMVSLSLRADGRLSYAFTWDGEKAHGTEQMPAPVNATLSDERIMELAKEHTWFNGSHAMTNYVAFARALLAV